MELSNEQIIKKLVSVSYQDFITNKWVYPLDAIIKEFNLGDVKDYVDYADDVKDKLNRISYPGKQVVRLYKEKGVLKNADLSSIGIIFVMAEISKTRKNKEMASFFHKISRAVFERVKIFYPEQREIFRREYVFVTKELRHLVKVACENSNNPDLKLELRKVYFSILSDYYSVSCTEDLQLKKTGKINGNYLDYITCSELNDLIEIQKEVVDFMKNHPDQSPLYLANRLANEKRMKFATNHGGCYPINYAPHTLTPKQAYAKFKKVLEEYGLDALSLKKDDDNLKTK